MAEQKLDIQELAKGSGAGLTLTPMITTDNYKFDNKNQGKNWVFLSNNGAGTVNVTITTPKTHEADLTVADRVIAVAAGEDRLIPPLDTSIYNDSGGQVEVNVDGADCSIAVAKAAA